MHSHSIGKWQHEHVFLGERHQSNERRTWFVVGLTAAMMIAEIVGGTIFGSMALVADGWHMSTHAAALGIAALAYRFARTHAHDPRFSFGTGKVGELAAFASAMILASVALMIGYESALRLVSPVAIDFAQALPIAVVGLLVNLVSAWLLHDRDHDGGTDHGHHHGHHHDHDHSHHGHHDHGHDSNIRAAYVHVLADALTSVLAIVALIGGSLYGLTWLDPVMGLVGTAVILWWSVTLIRSAGAVLLDVVPDKALSGRVRAGLEVEGDRVADLHLWRLGPGHTGVIATIVSDAPGTPAAYKERLRHIPGLSHITIEVQACPHHSPARPA
ncbi:MULTISPECIES: CDF family Co(II)/Ni(II) efflux transporter DmeF [unclassified Chelatococcus]|uniref:CDF family Co(II)/Ni(II) efflux transporter DmeF n=1 Tax=unclassified Chelatococcus TaxID=2638111 RepID=UPI001BD1306F|nr:MULTISPECIES: CDF family Co(II)/Ni(II) efflux transporter DmeF [unclassified Chelatococcus]MBS7698339.1 CDF family Co(II)/Ni(II) efflux transporter DmeF [Chelatococcus sp. YT9]MBX3559196.1 CDF family Co(II)/Ni(II) efflux transporter DmeF [Chelatococcus sp.]